MNATVTSLAVTHLNRVTAMPTDTEAARGDKVLATVRALKNLSADLLSDHAKHLLTASYWRAYRLPNGRQYEWNACEFDYFLAAADIDPRLIELAVREVNDRELLVALARASDQRHPRRRSVEVVVARYPELAGRLAAYRIGGLSVHRIIHDQDAVGRYQAGSGADVAKRERQWWRVSWSGQDDPQTAARAIVARLRSEPGMVAAVKDVLNESTVNQSIADQPADLTLWEGSAP